jgi:hypothetical protein
LQKSRPTSTPKLSVLDAHLKAEIAQEAKRPHPPSARKAGDGHHYVDDPARSGKYLLVVHHDGGCRALGRGNSSFAGVFVVVDDSLRQGRYAGDVDGAELFDRMGLDWVPGKARREWRGSN